MSPRGRWIVIAAVGVIVFLVAYAGQPGGTTSGFEAGRQLGYSIGSGLIAAGITYLVLRVFRRRS